MTLFYSQYEPDTHLYRDIAGKKHSTYRNQRRRMIDNLHQDINMQYRRPWNQLRSKTPLYYDHENKNTAIYKKNIKSHTSYGPTVYRSLIDIESRAIKDC